jgi:MFS family permease
MVTMPTGWRVLPRGATRDAGWILAGRGVRAFADGFVSLLLPAYLIALGFGPLAIGAIVTGTLLGSAALTLWVGLAANRYQRRRLLFWACLLMIGTGGGFALSTSFWPLLIVGIVGTLNPSAGDVSLFLPIEHTLLVQTVNARDRTSLFARYSLVGTLLGALGALAAGLPEWIAAATDLDPIDAIKAMFLLYGALGGVAALFYRPLSAAVEQASDTPRSSLGPSRRIVYGLAALFSIDAFGSGFFAQSLLALWLYQAFDLSVATAGAIFFWMSLCTAISYLAAVPLAARIGLLPTMVFTHLPSNLFLILVPFAPSLPIAIGLLMARSLLSQMDVPTRSSYVMAVVTPPERPAAASITSVPRSLATALAPLGAGYLLTLSSFGWPLIVGGMLKIIYDLLLLWGFRHIKPPEEDAATPMKGTAERRI